MCLLFDEWVKVEGGEWMMELEDVGNCYWVIGPFHEVGSRSGCFSFACFLLCGSLMGRRLVVLALLVLKAKHGQGRDSCIFQPWLLVFGHA